MGFTRDVAITTTTDFVKYGFEQELSNVERDIDALDNLQKAAVNVIIRDLSKRGVDYSDVTNTVDFVMEVIYWCLMTLYAGENPSALPGQSKHSYYMKMWLMERESRVIEFTDGSKVVPDEKGLPVVGNHDEGSFFPGLANGGQVLEGTIFPYADSYIFNRKNPRQ